jgi:hypothetical protein
MNRSYVSILGLLGLVACGSAAYSLRDAKNQEVPGIPFYPIVPAQVTVTTYEQAWVEVTMSFVVRPETRTSAEIAKNSKVPPPFTAGSDHTETTTRYITDPSYANQVIVAFDGAGEPNGAYDRAFTRVAACVDNNGTSVASCSTVPPSELSIDKIVALPSVGRDQEIVHTAGLTPLFINSTAPFGGSASAAFQFAADGTLTSTSSQVQDQLPAAIASSLSSIVGSLTSIAGKSTGTADKSNSTDSPWIISGTLASTVVKRLYAVTVVQAIDQAGKVVGQCGSEQVKGAFGSPSPDPSCRVSLTTQVVRGDANSPGGDAGPSNQGLIQFSGTVSLPAAIASGSASAGAAPAVPAATGGKGK